LKILECLIALGQNVDRVLDCYGAHALQAPPDLHAEIIRFRGNLVDQEKPAGFALFGHQLQSRHGDDSVARIRIAVVSLVSGGDRMKWITREKAKVDRIACPWLITKFIDPDPEFVFLPHDTN
jgi:hypothetical protein